MTKKQTKLWALLLIFWTPLPARSGIIEAVTETVAQARGREQGKGGPECQSLAGVSAPAAPVRAGKIAFQHRVMRCGERSELAMRKTKIGEKGQHP